MKPRARWLKGCILIGALGLWIASVSTACAQPAAMPDERDTPPDESRESMTQDPLTNWNLVLPTLGGKQFWTDHRWWHGWRVQYNKTLDHWRLINPSAVRLAWGSKEAVLAELAKVQSEHTDQADPEEVVVLLHGLIRSSASMQPIADEIGRRATPPHVEVLSFSYASTRDPVTVHAAAFREMMENLPGKPRWRAVGHSMGNIVLRAAIAQWHAEGDPKGMLSRLERVVMLGPPNQGSTFAKQLSRLGLFEVVTGDSGLQLGPQWSDFQAQLGVPPCPFAIIAGDISKHPIQNPWLSGASDGVVTIDEAKLDGMGEFATVPVLHSFLMRDDRCIKATVDYLFGGSIEASLSSSKEK